MIIAYKELRQLEMKIFKAQNSLALSNISLGNFYGIELDDFAHEVATLSLWLAEHQMNQLFFKEFGRTKPALPLMETGNIAHGNACRLNWESVCPKHENDEIYILGNPPYLGYNLQTQEQKQDMSLVFNEIPNYKKLDYISCWFYLGKKYISGYNVKYAFVTTNSICQGEQVPLLWPLLIDDQIEIGFAMTSFKWSNNAKFNAGVTVVIIGLKNIPKNKKDNKYIKYIYSFEKKIQADNINPYLAKGGNSLVLKRSKVLSNLPIMMKGSQPTDGGHLILDTNEKQEIERKYLDIHHMIKRFLGAQEFINDQFRYCLWIDDSDLSLIENRPEFALKFDKIKKMRELSTKQATKDLASAPHKFSERRYFKQGGIIVPSVSSERRDYIPIGFVDKDTVISNSANAIYSPEIWVFSVITSKMHMAWVKAVCGSLETRIRYSSALGYNTFPFPMISEQQKEMLKTHALNVINAREHNSGKTLAQLYDPDKMPDQLREAHHQLDLAVESCYRSKPFENDEERLAYLFKLYEEMIEREK